MKTGPTLSRSAPAGYNPHVRRAASIIESQGRTRPVQPGLFDPPPGTREQPTPPPRHVAFCVLASSSAGNCSVLRVGAGENYRLVLIDCGLSPRRTRYELAKLSLDPARIDDVLLTHLDHDHCHRGWANALPRHARFRLLGEHLKRARRAGLPWRACEPFDADTPFDLGTGLSVSACVQAHDQLGVAAFRLRSPAGRSLGYATDLGRTTQALRDHLAHADILAIESNYCPQLQRISNRPDFLKDRIMGGSGHLSNAECADFVRTVAPREHVVLLHLSQQCNTPALAIAEHADAPYALTHASPNEPTAWIDLVTTGAPAQA